MNKIALLISISFLVSCSHSMYDKIQDLSDNLNNLKTVRLEYLLETDYPEMAYQYKDTADCYLDFSSQDSIAKIRYQFITSKYINLYNGSEALIIDLQKGQMFQNRINDKKELSPRFLFQSFVTLRNFLPQLLKSDSILKTVRINDTTNNDYVIDFSIKNHIINLWGNLDKLDTNLIINYSIIVDKATNLPTSFTQFNNKDKTSYSRAKFNQIVKNANINDSIWIYSSYNNQYITVKSFDENSKELIKIGEVVKSWELPSISGKKVTLSTLKGNIVMLDFWHAHCGHCIKSIPKLNEIEKKYRQNKFKLLSLNFYDSKSTIEKILAKNKVDYEVLYNAQQIAKDYGVNYAPCVIIINQKGKVIYSGKFNFEEIISIIEKNK